MMPLAARLLSRLRARGVDVAAALVTHRMPLTSGARAYDVFAARTPGCVKVVLDCRADGADGAREVEARTFE